jgi:type I restriction enzyme R subunit
VNGCLCVQIELKRRGLEMKEDSTQINRYQKQFGAGKGLFHFVQLFVISNGKYQIFQQFWNT